ncbi:MAG TPA: hypothetical protein PKB10_07305 [Tepidisphaeraceae bacterium]|nr:hypothetical protein [Tepidisphaeraceae bacterium]
MILRFALILLLLPATTAPARPTLDQVFKGINQSMDAPADLRRPAAVLIGLVGLILLIAVLNRGIKLGASGARRSREPNHPHKLAREIARRVGLRRSELKQLRIVAESQNLQSPLTVLLCPSLLARSIKQPDLRTDRAVLAGLARKLLDKPASRN